jgi:hypothetical protein
MKVETRKSDVWSEEGCVSGWTVTVTYDDNEMAELLSAYDPESNSSPPVAHCRPTVREILDKVKEALN